MSKSAIVTGVVVRKFANGNTSAKSFNGLEELGELLNRTKCLPSILRHYGYVHGTRSMVVGKKFTVYFDSDIREYGIDTEHKVTKVCVKNYHTNHTTMPMTLLEASRYIGVTKATVKQRLIRTIENQNLRIMDGYGIVPAGWIKEGMRWPRLSEAEVKESYCFLPPTYGITFKKPISTGKKVSALY